MVSGKRDLSSKMRDVCWTVSSWDGERVLQSESKRPDSEWKREEGK